MEFSCVEVNFASFVVFFLFLGQPWQGFVKLSLKKEKLRYDVKQSKSLMALLALSGMQAVYITVGQLQKVHMLDEGII